MDTNLIILAAAYYKNFSVDDSFLTEKIIIIALFAGITIAVIMSLYDHIYLGRLVKKVTETETYYPDESKTLDELGMKHIKGFSSSLKKGKTLRKYIKISNEDTINTNHKKNPKIDVKAAKLYMDPWDKDEALQRYKYRSSTVPVTIVLLVFLLAATIFLIWVIPELLTMLDNFITIIKGL